MSQQHEHFRMRAGDHRLTLAALLFQGNLPDLTIQEAIAKFGIERVFQAALGTVRLERFSSRLPFHFPPTVFVSYRRSTPAVEAWVKRLVEYIRGRGHDAKFDMENPIVDYMSIPTFVSNLAHSDTVVLVNTGAYAADKQRLWIKEERHDALLTALDGHCDLLVLRCDDMPLADEWMEFFPTVSAQTDSDQFDYLDEYFPKIPVLGPAQTGHINNVLADIKERMWKEQDGSLLAKLESEPHLMLAPRAQELLAYLKPALRRSGNDTSLAERFIERLTGRRIAFARFMAERSSVASAITSLRPLLRSNDQRGPEAHRIIGSILEELGQYNGARNHFKAGVFQQFTQRRSIPIFHIYGIISCSLKLFEGAQAISLLHGLSACDEFKAQDANVVQRAIDAASQEKFSEAIWVVDHDLRQLQRGVDVHRFTEQDPVSAYISCPACKCEFDISSTRYHVCACCSCSYADPLAVSDPEGFLNCPVCSHTGEISIQVIMRGIETRCAMCGVGQLELKRANPNDPQRRRFSVTTTDEFFNLLKRR